MNAGLKIPGDVSIISWDGTDAFSHMSPRIDRYVVDWEKYARSYSKAVVQLAKTGRLPRKQTLFEPDYIQGDSVNTL